MLNTKEIQTILLDGENQTVEFKTSFQKEVIESVVSSANSKGGHIYIGVSDDSALIGVDVSDETIQNYINIIKQSTDPKIIVDIDLIPIEDKNILDIQVDEYPIKPVSYRGRYFKRRNNSNHQMTPIEISNSHLKTINSSWDYFEDQNHDISDIDEVNVKTFIEMAGLDGEIQNVYNKFELVKNNAITNGCYLLFNNNESSLFTNIEIGRFQTEILIKDSLSIHGAIINQVDVVMGFIYKHINKAYIITGKPQRDEVWDYPMDAIREIVENMIVHRDYQSNIHSVVKIFDDKIEFYNQGKLPDGLSIEDVKNGTYRSMPRNLQIADIFKTADIIEKYGSGIKRVVKLFKEYGSKEPSFEDKFGGMVVVAYKKDPFEKTTPKTTPKQVSTKERLVQYMVEDLSITREELAQKLNISINGVKQHILTLKKDGVLKRIGSGRSGYWEVIDEKIFE